MGKKSRRLKDRAGGIIDYELLNKTFNFWTKQRKFKKLFKVNKKQAFYFLIFQAYLLYLTILFFIK